MDPWEWLKKINLDYVPSLATKAMWCGHRSHKDYSTRFPWIVKNLIDMFKFSTYVEIGIAGAGGIEMASEYGASLIIGVDPLESPPESYTIKNKIFKKSNVHLVRKKSESAIEDVMCLLADRKIDLLIIDGDHTYEGSKADFLNYGPLVNKGGFIWLDDIAHEPGVKKTWKEIKNNKAGCPFDYEYFDWGLGEIEGGLPIMGIDGVWILKK